MSRQLSKFRIALSSKKIQSKKPYRGWPSFTCSSKMSQSSEKEVSIDGSMMEGGGQILRMSIAFSALLNQPVRIYNIRAGRSSPGLRPQHLAGIKLVAEITSGNLKGAEVGSTEVTFHPGRIQAGKYNADPKTAGSVILLFQVSFPVLLFADGPTQLSLRGGTNADMAPQIDHTLEVFKPIVEHFGAKFTCDIIKRGYYPRGGGEVRMNIFPVTSHLTPCQFLNTGEVIDIKGYSFAAGKLSLQMAHSMANAASKSLEKIFPGKRIDIPCVKEDPRGGNSAGIVICAKTDTGCLFGGSGLLSRDKKDTEEIGQLAAQDIIDAFSSKTCVDSYVQDQLVIFMALAKGTSKVRIGTPTLHTKTAIYIAEIMTKARFQMHPTEKDDQSSMILECEGIGLERS